MKRKIYRNLFMVMSILFLITAFLCLYGAFKEGKRLNKQKLHLITSELTSQLETNYKYEQETKLSYAILHTDGKVAYQKGTKLPSYVNLHSLMLTAEENNMITVPVLCQKSTVFFLAIVIPDECYGTGNLIPVFFSLLFLLVSGVSIFLFLSLTKTLKRDVFEPVHQLFESTRDILNGNMTTPVPYDFDGEIGKLCHDFELMRRELIDSLNREQKVKNDEKLLMASISHDLKTPLAAIQGYMESICLSVVTDREEILRYAEGALNKAQQLSDMTNDILELSQAEMHELSIHKEEVYSKEYFSSLLTELRLYAEGKGFSFTSTDIPNRLISLDRIRIAEVLDNLVGNAVKYGKSEGTIHVSFSEAGSEFHVAVEDNGIGIAAEDIPFVFDRFFRGDRARTQGVKGSGLGLSIAKYIISQHNGKIECDSVLHKGTKVEFSLPF